MLQTKRLQKESSLRWKSQISYQKFRAFNGTLQREIWDSHSGNAEDASLLGKDAMSLCEQFPVFRKTVVPSYSVSSRPSISTASRNVGNYSSNGTASHPTRLQSSFIERCTKTDPEPHWSTPTLAFYLNVQCVLILSSHLSSPPPPWFNQTMKLKWGAGL